MNDQIVTIDSHAILITEEDTGRISFQYPADFDVEGFDVLEVGFVSEATMYGFDAYALMPSFKTSIRLVQSLTGFKFIGEYTDPGYAILQVLTALRTLHGTGLLPFHEESFWVERTAKFIGTQDNQLTITLTNDD